MAWPASRRIKHSIEHQLVRLLPEPLCRFLGFLYGLTVRRTSYSQCGADLILLNYFNRIGVGKGVYVDIGCFHPTWISNTYLFHKLGWRGVAVDLDPYKVKSFDLMRRGKCTTYLGAICVHSSTQMTRAPIYRFRRLWSEMDTLDKRQAEQMRAEIGIDFYEDSIPLIDVRAFFDGLDTVNFLNIDTVGLDETVLLNIDLDRLRPEAVLFDDYANFGGSEKIRRHLESHGYERLFVSNASVCYVQNPARIARA